MDLSSRRSRMIHKLCLLYMLNLTDWICTVMLVRTGAFYEANPIMRPVIDSLPLGFVIKCILPALVIAAVIRLLSGFAAGDLLRVDRAAAFVLTVYASLCLGHIVNFAILFAG